MNFQDRHRIVQAALRQVMRHYSRAKEYQEDLAQEGHLKAWQMRAAPREFVYTGVKFRMFYAIRRMATPISVPYGCMGISFVPDEALAEIAASEGPSELPRPLRLVKKLNELAGQIPSQPRAPVSLERRVNMVEMYYRHQAGESYEFIAADFGITRQAVHQRVARAAQYLEAEWTPSQPSRLPGFCSLSGQRAA